MQIFGSNKDNKPKGTRNVDTHYGNFEEYQKMKAKELPKIQKAIQELFEDYDGGGVAIVMNTYDENNNATGARMMVSGVDSVEGLVSLAEATHKASEEIIENIQQSGNPMAMMEAIMAMLKRKGHNHED